MSNFWSHRVATDLKIVMIQSGQVVMVMSVIVGGLVVVSLSGYWCWLCFGLIRPWSGQALLLRNSYRSITTKVCICVLVGNPVNVDICGDSEGAGGAAGQLM